jgi:hypothetical protein
MDILPGFRITSVSNPVKMPPHRAAAAAAGLPAPDLLGLLADLRDSKWKGTGFNQVWRPNRVAGLPAQDHFLELNEFIETLQFEEIPGDIPNRGLLQGDINLHGLTYLQQVQDAIALGPNGEKFPGIHIEPGIWVSIQKTDDPSNLETVARLANIPHGTSLVAQGSASKNGGPPNTFAPVSITPFPIGSPGTLIPFPESNLGVATQFRTAPGDIPHVTQAMVDNPNVVLDQGIAGKNFLSTTTLKISTTPLNPPSTGGGASNIAFLQGAANGPNAQAVNMDATFWIETIDNGDGTTTVQLQYSQLVLLNFNSISWPHVSVATLIKQP